MDARKDQSSEKRLSEATNSLSSTVPSKKNTSIDQKELRPKTIAITLHPNFTQEDIRSPERPASMVVVFGPRNGSVTESGWIFEWNIYSKELKNEESKTKNHSAKKDDNSRNPRAILWYADRPFGQHRSAVPEAKCRFIPELNPQSIVFRLDHKDKQENAFSFVRTPCTPTQQRTDLGFFNVAKDHSYHLNITFLDGNTAHRYVHELGWQFTLFLLTKTQNYNSNGRGVDDIAMTRLYTNWSVAWANGNEPAPNETELAKAHESIALDLEDEKMLNSSAARAVTAARAAEVEAKAKSLAEAKAKEVKTIEDIKEEAEAQRALAKTQWLPVRPKRSLAKSNWACDVMPLLTTQSTLDPPDEEELATIKLPFETTYPLTQTLNTCKRIDGSLEATLCDVEKVIRAFAKDKTHRIVDQANALYGFLDAVPQLSGWHHVRKFVKNPMQYVTTEYPNLPVPEFLTTKASSKMSAPVVLATAPAQQSEEDELVTLQQTGKALITRLCKRVAHLKQMRDAAHDSVNDTVAARAMVYYLASDRKLVSDAQAFVKDAQLKVSQLLTRNATRFAQFRELIRERHPTWPHSQQMLKEIVETGFVFKPMMIKRDLCICSICLVEVSGWRPWHDPRTYHDAERHRVYEQMQQNLRKLVV